MNWLKASILVSCVECSLLSLAGADAGGLIELDVIPIRELEVIDDHFRFEVVLEEQGHGGNKNTGRLYGGRQWLWAFGSLCCSTCWHLRDGESAMSDQPAKEPETSSGTVLLMELAPMETRTMVLDIRDYFDRIDLSSPSVEVELSANILVPAGNTSDASLSPIVRAKRVLRLRVADLKGVEVGL